MYRHLGEGRLHSGERLSLGVIEAPDPEWAEQISRFLAHKGGDWNYHIQQALQGPLDDLETRFYVGSVDEAPISQVMITGRRPAGILGHVFTTPAWRQRGAYRQVMAAQMADVKRLGYAILTLGTGYNSHPYWIYHSFGFRSIAPETGTMRWLADPEAQDRFLSAGPAHARPLRWGDWAALNVLALLPVGPEEPLPRLPALGIKGQRSVEGPFLTFMRRCRGLPSGSLRALASATGAVVGWCFLAPDPRWYDDAWLLDAGTLPAFGEHWPALTAELPWPDAPVYALQTANAQREEALASLGFRPLARLPRWLKRSGDREEVHLWLRG